MDNKQQIITDLLKEYARQQGTTVRSTSDLSPLEEWLLCKLTEKVDSKLEINDDTSPLS